MVNKEFRYFITTKEGKYFEPNWIMEGYQEGEKLLLRNPLNNITEFYEHDLNGALEITEQNYDYLYSLQMSEAGWDDEVDKKFREKVKELEDERNITLHCYTDQLINNEDGKFDKFGSAWFTVPWNWAEELANLQGFSSLEEFLKEYTYDNTDDWLSQAIEEGVLIGTGTGDMRDY
ncbi:MULTISPECIES: hypothetical protein [Bacillaceae]|uniref:hypothetical protein n=1 Tax=Bacillaceae TaxID=186817 RepID=UPI0006629A13|nr:MULTISPECIES: hypothetical protein [Bacillaceae]MCF7625519.1 hypothetical protein [Peribacillus frigoritolerans]PRA73233.1 hypothetical protein CQ056_28270 [Peribacillus simplex]